MIVKDELIKRSPLRILEKTTHGNLRPGEIAVIASRKGVGKTACLVHIATDQLLQDKHVIHVSFLSNSKSIITWYEDIFKEITSNSNLKDSMGIYDHIIKNRVVMNFQQDGIHITSIENSIKNMINEGHFVADTLIIDGYDFSKSSINELQDFKSFAKEWQLSLWFSASINDGNTYFDGQTIPTVLEPLSSEIAIIINLQPKSDHIHLKLVKDYGKTSIPDSFLDLDPKTLLIRERKED